ncbi:MAG TPA: hypothetical protein ENH21_03260, partial [Chromatiales bacterium]|nr:hypothetical protein [Chromatiales bacterium]HEX22429.1 hypothetical protein [Chromatiales bacterium]
MTDFLRCIKRNTRRAGLFITVALLLTACGDGVQEGVQKAAWNDPYAPGESIKNIYYSSFSLRPKHLDPA